MAGNNGNRLLDPLPHGVILQAKRHVPAVSRLHRQTLTMERLRRLDVLVPTHNRAGRLDGCLKSVLNAKPYAGLEVHVTVICNACTDGSQELVRRLQAAYPRRMSLLEERRRGKSRALNLGIASTSGDLIGMIDDDEEVDATWIEVIGAAFEDPALDFAGGPYVAVWPTPPPDWLPDDYLAVLGSVDNGSVPREYDHAFPGILKGGNAVIRRRTLERVGPFAEHLGPGSFSRLFSCEDEDMYLRLLEAGAKGKYLPRLVIYHYIDEQRLTREYYRSWCFWRGVSRGMMDRRHPMPVPYLAGVPRFLWGSAARGFWRLAASFRQRPSKDSFEDELRMWDVAGFFYGRHIYALARFSPVRSRRQEDRNKPNSHSKHDKVELAG
jgi:glycosyltransferase involved in cell wall biosynthesis